MRSAAADFPTAVGPEITITLGRIAPPPSAMPPRDSPTEPIREVHFFRTLLQNERPPPLPPPGAQTVCVRLAASTPRLGWPRAAGGGAARRRSPRCTGRGRPPDPAGNRRVPSPCLGSASGAPAPSTAADACKQRIVTPSREREGHAARRHWRICRRHARFPLAGRRWSPNGPAAAARDLSRTRHFSLQNQDDVRYTRPFAPVVQGNLSRARYLPQRELSAQLCWKPENPEDLRAGGCVELEKGARTDSPGFGGSQSLPCAGANSLPTCVQLRYRPQVLPVPALLQPGAGHPGSPLPRHARHERLV